MLKSKRKYAGRNFATSAYIRYVNQSLLSHQYARASQGLLYLGTTSANFVSSFCKISLACIHGLNHQDFSEGRTDATLKFYLKLLNSTSSTPQRVGILIEILTFHLLIYEHSPHENRIKRLQDGFSMLQSYLQDKEFQMNSLLHGYCGLLALSIYCFYAENDGVRLALCSTSNAWVPFTGFVFMPNEREYICPSSVTRKWLVDAIKLLRKSQSCDPDSDLFAEHLVRALVAQAGIESSNPNAGEHMRALRDREEWEEIRVLLDHLEKASGQNPAVARLRFHTAWDLDGVFPNMKWATVGLKWLQMDALADYHLVFVPVIEDMFKTIAISDQDSQAVALKLLIPILLDRIETGCNSNDSSLWYFLAKALKTFRCLPQIPPPTSLFELRDILFSRKFWWPSIYFQLDSQISTPADGVFPVFNESCAECPNNMGFLRCVCARLLLFPAPGEFFFPGENSTIDYNQAPILLQSREVDYLRSLYPDLDTKIVF
ncbi:hypothetical protein DSO57_1021505 [Entomophthora muscae]|uniref:Uncharacterized protein n=1 Tax=Entomophthora muscae TaxID=34485 RepID=A0ACC2S5J4_9FUNG|nr:hypothetical protein DSO57_1021505 [Entomophthora muscae]